MATNNSINNTVYENDFSVNRSTAGTAVESSVEHSDNSNTGSHARLLAQAGGTSGGDPFVRFNISGAQDYSFGIDNTDSDSLKIQDDADPSTGNNLWALTASGERNMPLQPCFNAYVSTTITNVTGDNTKYTIIFDTELEDQSSDYNNTTGVFTASVDGQYTFGVSIGTRDNGAAHTSGIGGIETSDYSYLTRRAPSKVFVVAGGVVDYLLSVIAPMDAADTASAYVRVSGGALVVDVWQFSYGSDFHGKLEC